MASWRIAMKFPDICQKLDISTYCDTGWAHLKALDLVESGVLKHKSKSFFLSVVGSLAISELGRAINLPKRAYPKTRLPFRVTNLWSRRTQSWDLTAVRDRIEL